MSNPILIDLKAVRRSTQIATKAPLENIKGPAMKAGPFYLVAGVGFEPTTFGL